MEYDIQLSGAAIQQFADMRSRAVAANKDELFDWRYEEILRALRNPSQAIVVGKNLRQTNLPGGFWVEWQHHFLYIRYAVFPDAGRGFVWHMEFNPPNWA